MGIEHNKISPKKPREARSATEAAIYISQIRAGELCRSYLGVGLLYARAASKPPPSRGNQGLVL